MKTLINTLTGAMYNMNYMINTLPIKYYSGKYHFTIYFSNNNNLIISTKDKVEIENIRCDIQLFLTDNRKQLQLK